MTKVKCAHSTRKVGFRGSEPKSWGYCPYSGAKVELIKCLGKKGYEKYFGKPEFGELDDYEPCKFCLGVSDTIGIKKIKPQKDGRWQKTIKIPVEVTEQMDKGDLQWMKEEIKNIRKIVEQK